MTCHSEHKTIPLALDCVEFHEPWMGLIACGQERYFRPLQQPAPWNRLFAQSLRATLDIDDPYE
jgi:hypothetical protein